MDEDVKKYVAKTFIAKAVSETGRTFKSLQDLIDSVYDHNQLMLDSIEVNDPELREQLGRLLDTPWAWNTINSYFDSARELIES